MADGAANALQEADLNSLLQLCRRRLFEVWRPVLPLLSKLSGTFEIFNPANGANMGWHQVPKFQWWLQ
jgi:hypothetical protein